MDNNLLALIASFPFLILFVLLIFKRWPAVKALPITWLLTLLISVFFWNVQRIYILSSFVKGILMAMEIMLIVFGAVWLLELVKQTNHMKTIQNFLSNISNDARVQGIIIGWFFVSLMEGVAGFGTPAAVTAPLLVALGFTPLLAVTVTLIANSVATTFGAAGTPILLGFGSLGFENQILQQSANISALIHSIASIIIPLSIVYIITLQNKKPKSFRSMIPFILFSWLVFSIPYLFVTIFVGPELPSIIASIISLVVLSFLAKKKFLLPKNEFIFKKTKAKHVSLKNTISSFMPYIFVISFLLFTRAFMPLRTLLTSISISWNNIFGSSVSHSYLPLFTPAFYFLISIIISFLFYKTNSKIIFESFKHSVLIVKNAFFALIFAVGLVQLFIVSENNFNDMLGMPMIIANSVGNLFGNFFPFVSPFIGSLGSFISGSNTVSNILFGLFQSESAIALGLSIPLILALQAVGGAVGNMIAIHNVVAASATVGLENQESSIIKKTILVMFVYLAFAGLLGLILMNIF